MWLGGRDSELGARPVSNVVMTRDFWSKRLSHRRLRRSVSSMPSTRLLTRLPGSNWMQPHDEECGTCSEAARRPHKQHRCGCRQALTVEPKVPTAEPPMAASAGTVVALSNRLILVPLPTLSALTGVEQASHLEWDVTCRASASFRTRSARHARTEPHCLHPHVGGEKVYPLLTHNPLHTIRPAHDVTSIAARRSPLPRAGASESEGEAACATTQVAAQLSFYFHCTRARPS